MKMTNLRPTFRGVPLIPPIDCSDPDSWIAQRIYEMGANDARAAMRPEPPSLKGLKEQALRDLNHAYKKDQIDDITFENIQEALEALPND
jgi:hypothetical protein